MYQNTHHHMWWVKAKHQCWIRDASQDRQPKIHSSLVRETLQKIMEQTNNDCWFRIFILTKFPNPALFACWKIRFKTEVCTCSQFLTEAMLWIKEVEMVESVYDLKSSCSITGIRMPDFLRYSTRKLLEHWTESSITRFKKKVSLEEQKKPKRGPFLSWKTNRFLDLRVLLGHWSQWFCRELCRPIYNCSSKWWYSGIRFEMGRKFIVYDEYPTWWHLGRIVQIKNTRVWETQDRIGIVRPGDSSKEVRTWLSQIESYGEKKYRTRNSK